MNFDFKQHILSDDVFMTYNNVIQCVDMFILDFIKNSIMSDSFILDTFNNSDDNNLLRMLNRKEEDVFNLLSKHGYLEGNLYREYLSIYPSKYNESYITDFIKGFNVYMRTKSAVNKLVISANSSVKQDIVKSIFGDDIKIEFVDDDDSTIEKYIRDPSFKLIFTDRSDLVNKNISFINGKVICFPYVSYLFNIDIQDGQNIMISKDNWEIKSFNKDFTIGYFEPFKITEKMFVIG